MYQYLVLIEGTNYRLFIYEGTKRVLTHDYKSMSAAIEAFNYFKRAKQALKQRSVK
jgi:hypothetical protein